MNEELNEKLKVALTYVRMALPHVEPVLAALDVRFDDRISTAGVSASGRLLIAPDFARKLTVRHLAFVVAHELYHVFYGVFDRFRCEDDAERHRLINIAHDFIINDMLERDLDKHPGWSVEPDFGGGFVPDEGLFWRDYEDDYWELVGSSPPNIENCALETLVLELERIRALLPKTDMMERLKERDAQKAGEAEASRNLGSMAGALASLGDLAQPSEGEKTPERAGSLKDLLSAEKIPELIDDELEGRLFPEETAVDRNERVEKVRIAVDLAGIHSALHHQVGMGTCAGDGSAVLQALKGRYVMPWEAALQKWIDDAAPRTRTWSRASRRGGDGVDVVLPGRTKEGWTLNIVLDTSGSMVDELPRLFGMIQSFGRGAGVSEVRLVQCDAEVSADELVDIDRLSSFEVSGFGGSDMSPAMLMLAEDASVDAVLVLTDGCIAFPEDKDIPYRVLWGVVTTDESDFNPGYGTVLRIREGE